MIEVKHEPNVPFQVILNLGKACPELGRRNP
jgi:hypothetical protein